MKLKTERYEEQLRRLPATGKQIIAARDEENIIVYQAFNPSIAAYAVRHQQFGGPDYSFSRMSWIKPGFLWMMYRSGWAQKPQQEKILALTLPIVHLTTILEQATISSFDPALFSSQEAWKQQLDKTEVRLQWDPDHDPWGRKQERKAIQLGMKGDILKLFCTVWVKRIEDVTPFVETQYQQVLNTGSIVVPLEEIIMTNPEIENKIGITVPN